jgi:hypothetical protein
MLGNDNQNDNNKLLILKLIVQDAQKHKIDPTFEIREKIEGKWVVTGTNASVSGDLTRIEIKENNWEGNVYHTVSLTLKDSVLGETYLVDTKLNMLSRSLYNSLLNLEEYTDLKIGLYTSKKDFASVALRQKGNMVNWKFSLSEIPAPIEVSFKNKIQRDFTPTDDFFIEKLRELSVKLTVTGAEPASKPAAPKAKSAPKKKEVIKEKEDVDGDVNIDDSSSDDLF